MTSGKAWTQTDRYGNSIYLTWERWAHIVDPDNHPEVEPYFDLIKETVQEGRRRQDKYDPNAYQYYHSYSGLPGQSTHLIVCVRYRWPANPDGTIREEKFVTTAYFQFLDR